MVIKDSGVHVPGLIHGTSKQGGDSGNALVGAQVVGQLRQIPGEVTKGAAKEGIVGAVTRPAAKLLHLLGTPQVTAYLLGLNKALPSEKIYAGAGQLSDEGLTAISNVSRVLPEIFAYNMREVPTSAGDPYVYTLEDLQYGL
jgi:hypothetical protein